MLRESAGFVLSGSNVRCELHIADNLPSADVDEGQLNQVLNNIIINARQAMPDGGTITITAAARIIGPVDGLPLAEGNYLEIAIADQGCGIAPENLGRIFDPFFTTKEKGNGLGLSTSYTIIRKHGGHLAVESEVNRGTVFRIYLPASEHAEEASGEQRTICRGACTGRVLLMDDEEIIRQTARQILAWQGYQVETAADGLEALVKYRAAMQEGRPYVCVIMDLTIPGGVGGREAVDQLRRLDPEVRVIVSSGYSNDPVMSDYRNFGFSGIIVKPYRADELLNEISRVLSS
jgi:CheY-like chemotaxis protein